MLVAGLILAIFTVVPATANAAGAPSTTTDPATGVTSSEATLNGKVTSNGNDTSAHFQYVANADYAPSTPNPYSAGRTTPGETVSAGTTTDKPASAFISRLQPNTVYHYRLVASNSAGTAQGDDQTFQTSGSGPPPQAVSFAPAVNYPVASTPVSIGHGDLDGDGKQDLVTASSSGVVSVSLGSGDTPGTFKTPITTTLPQGNSPVSSAVGDLDGDGKPDVVVQSGTKVSVLLGKGDGRFATPVDYAAAKVPGFNGDTPYLSSMALADVSGDGRPDILLTEGETPCCNAVGAEVMVNSGNGTFGTPDRYGTGNTYNIATSVTAADVYGDGRPALIVSNNSCCFAYSTVSVFRGTGGGKFDPSSRADYGVLVGAGSVGARDLNGDGKPDLAVLSAGYPGYNGTQPTLSIFLNKGDGTFQQPLQYRTANTGANSPSAGPQSLSLADVNGDGSLDAITTNSDRNYGPTVAVFVNNGNGTFQEHQEAATDAGPSAVTAGDFNGDGKPDLATANRGSASDVSVLLNTTPFPGPGPGPTKPPLTVSLSTPYSACSPYYSSADCGVFQAAVGGVDRSEAHNARYRCMVRGGFGGGW